MKGKNKIVLIALLILAGIIVIIVFASHFKTKKAFNFIKIEKGKIESTVSSTGTLKLINSVNINSQISGKIARVLVDYNQKVKKGQVLAVLDTTLLKLAVDEASCSLEKSEMEYGQAKKTYDDTKSMFDLDYKSKADLDTAEISLKSAGFALKNAQITLEKVRNDLAYATITSPFDGIIIDKNAEVGQSVNINVSETALFVVSSDLEKMEIYATIDESDISKVKAGQTVNFTVQSYSDKNFQGAVSQIHLEPSTSQNVVYYSVVIDVDNHEGLLYPGMTATLDLVLESHSNTLKVSNSVFKFRPPAGILAHMPPPGSEKAIRGGTKSPSTEKSAQNQNRQVNIPAFLPNTPGGGGNSKEAGQVQNIAFLYTLNSDTGKLQPIPVKTGLNDGQMTEIFPLGPADGEIITEGTEVVSGIAEQNGKNSTSQKSVINPFGGGPMGGGPGPGPGGN